MSYTKSIDLTIIQGDTVDPIYFIFGDPVSKQPVNLAGATAELVVRKSLESRPVLQLSTSAGMSINASIGQVVVNTISAEETAKLEVGTYQYYLRLTLGGNTKTRIAGKFTIKSA